MAILVFAVHQQLDNARIVTSARYGEFARLSASAGQKLGGLVRNKEPEYARARKGARTSHLSPRGSLAAAVRRRVLKRIPKIYFGRVKKS